MIPKIRVRVTLAPSAVAWSSPSATAFKELLISAANRIPTARNGATEAVSSSEARERGTQPPSPEGTERLLIHQCQKR